MARIGIYEPCPPHWGFPSTPHPSLQKSARTPSHIHAQKHRTSLSTLQEDRLASIQLKLLALRRASLHLKNHSIIERGPMRVPQNACPSLPPHLQGISGFACSKFLLSSAERRRKEMRGDERTSPRQGPLPEPPNHLSSGAVQSQVRAELGGALRFAQPACFCSLPTRTQRGTHRHTHYTHMHTHAHTDMDTYPHQGPATF